MLCYGPEENSHVANYRLALTKFPRSINREKWSETERGNLQKGIKQQFQEMLLQKSVTFFRYFLAICCPKEYVKNVHVVSEGNKSRYSLAEPISYN